MKIVVHAGMQKTGSSAIQDYLYEQRGPLAAMGVTYPDFGYAPHWLVAAAFVSNPARYHHVVERFRGTDSAPALASVRDTLKKWVRAPREVNDVLLISHEDLSVARTALRMNNFLKEAAEEPVEITYVAYVRHPISGYPSAVQQTLKSNRAKDFSPASWKPAHIARAQRLSAAIGDRLILRPFAPPGVETWSVIEDFRSLCATLIGRELPPAPPKQPVNSSMSAEACALLEASRKLASSRPPPAFLARIVRTFDKLHGGSRLRAPADWNAAIAAVNGPDWNRIVDMLDCSDDAKAALRFDSGTRAPTDAAYDVHGWLVSNLDCEWCRDFVAFCADPENAAPHSSRVGDWVEQNLLRQIDALKEAR